MFLVSAFLIKIRTIQFPKLENNCFINSQFSHLLLFSFFLFFSSLALWKAISVYLQFKYLWNQIEVWRCSNNIFPANRLYSFVEKFHQKRNYLFPDSPFQFSFVSNSPCITQYKHLTCKIGRTNPFQIQFEQIVANSYPIPLFAPVSKAISIKAPLILM